MDVCYEVIIDNSKAEELLPTSEGFFGVVLTTMSSTLLRHLILIRYSKNL